MENAKEIHKHYFITVNGDEYPLFDDDITVEEMDDMINHSKLLVKEAEGTQCSDIAGKIDQEVGINIPNLRNIICIGIPPSKEWLYQEGGRVGRSSVLR